jgi:transcriptional regulator
VGKRKLSQNKDARDREGAADQLHARGSAEMAALMRQAGQDSSPS